MTEEPKKAPAELHVHLDLITIGELEALENPVVGTKERLDILQKAIRDADIRQMPAPMLRTIFEAVRDATREMGNSKN